MYRHVLLSGTSLSPSSNEAHFVSVCSTAPHLGASSSPCLGPAVGTGSLPGTGIPDGRRMSKRRARYGAAGATMRKAELAFMGSCTDTPIYEERGGASLFIHLISMFLKMSKRNKMQSCGKLSPLCEIWQRRVRHMGAFLPYLQYAVAAIFTSVSVLEIACLRKANTALSGSLYEAQSAVNGQSCFKAVRKPPRVAS
ncbi:hypothetical protein M441DRAFT_50982 [Trichoderma asperellum CBS 433.97]|uniref:Uncharacterized protein n=1 Tax=Trichoderma asperellum (strain ATCC 204424 / CBS 433.97 / NBRC 101777) TaxID=1042311 RepID=A0A2T3YWR6_TRIA4|nr:hypothetical protein M441DRAFT_50982 [Trichoderma asperellum CBS 433.97]PTB36977.1 hypothetical protein M441DRAFT_50982 [Trichoderma asperellum CBS 433.97]